MLIINCIVYLDGSQKNTKKQTKNEVENIKLGKMTREEEGQSVVESQVYIEAHGLFSHERFKIRGNLGQIW